MFEVGGNTANNAFQLAMQQCCGANCSNLLLVLLHLKEENETAKNSALSITNLVIKTRVKYIDY